MKRRPKIGKLINFWIHLHFIFESQTKYKHIIMLDKLWVWFSCVNIISITCIGEAVYNVQPLNLHRMAIIVCEGTFSALERNCVISCEG